MNKYFRQHISDWVCGKGIFKNMIQNKTNAKLERDHISSIVPRCNTTTQWTTHFGESLAEHVLQLLYGNISRPALKDGIKPDFESDDFIFEIKTRTWGIPGSAGEKILGTPYKYRNVYNIYKKPLIIILVAYQEKEAVERFKLFDAHDPGSKLTAFYKEEFNISYVRFSELYLKALDLQNKMTLKPFVKWAGGKSTVKHTILSKITLSPNSLYAEPFVGGGTILFNLQPKNAIINDSNKNLMCCYEQIKTNLPPLISALEQLDNHYKSLDTDSRKEFYYTKRDEYNKEKFIPSEQTITDEVKIASLFIFLNKTCFNGLYRENSKGLFNTPVGSYKNPEIVNASLLSNISAYLNSANIALYSLDYKDLLEIVKIEREKYTDTTIYLDPPYYPSETSSFIAYGKDKFDVSDQENLASTLDTLSTLENTYVLMSNSYCPQINTLYENYQIQPVSVERSISSKTESRGANKEVLITNYFTI